MENQVANKEYWHSLLTGQWWRDYIKCEAITAEDISRVLMILQNPRDRDRENWLEILLPADDRIGLQGGLTPGTVEFSVPMSEEGTDALRVWRDMNVTDPHNSVFLDTTCLETVRRLMGGEDEDIRDLSPLTLLDLNTFVSSAIMYDRIYHLQNPYFNSQNIKALFGDDLFYELPVEDVDTHKDFQPYFAGRGISIENNLQNIYKVARQWSSLLRGKQLPRYWRTGSCPWIGSKETATQVKILSESWKTLLGQEVPLELLLGDPNEELGRWESPAYPLILALRQADKSYKDFHPDDFVDRSIVTESNHRAMFNHILAHDVLELPYEPSSARWPFRRFLYSACKEWRDIVLHPSVAELPSVQRLENHYQKKVAEIARESEDIQLPIFLAIILNRVNRLSEIPEEIASWREAAARFRERRRELDETLKDETSKGAEIDRIMKALKDEASDPKGWVFVKAGAIPAAVLAIFVPTFFGASPLAGALVSAVLTLPSLFDPQTLKKLHRRLFRREYYFLTKIGYAIDELTKASTLEKIKSLWKLREDDVEELPHRLHELKVLQMT